MAIDWDDVIAIAPETVSAVTATRTAILALVDLRIPDETWGDYADAASAYLAAHYCTVKDSAGRSPLTHEKVGPLATSHADIFKLGEIQTSYYLEFLQLRRLLPTELGL